MAISPKDFQTRPQESSNYSSAQLNQVLVSNIELILFLAHNLLLKTWVCPQDSLCFNSHTLDAGMDKRCIEYTVFLNIPPLESEIFEPPTSVFLHPPKDQ